MSVRRRAAVLSTLALVLAVTTSGAALADERPTPPRAGSGTLLEEVPRSGELRVCTTGDYRPFTYRDPKTGVYSGIDIDMARDLAKSLGARAEFVPTTWGNLLTDLTGIAVTSAWAGSR